MLKTILTSKMPDKNLYSYNVLNTLVYEYYSNSSTLIVEKEPDTKTKEVEEFIGLDKIADYILNKEIVLPSIIDKK